MAIVEQGLTAKAVDRPGLVVLELSGQLTAREAPILFDAVDRALEGTPPNLQLDMHNLVFIDFGGVQALVRVRERLRDAAIAIQLLAPSWRVRQMLDVNGFSNLFDIVE